MDLEQLAAYAVAKFRDAAVRFQLHPLEKNPARQRIAVRVQAAGGQPDYCVARTNSFAVQHPGLFHDAHNRAAHIVFAGTIKPRHLRGLAADERAAVSGATADKPLNQLAKNARFEFSGADVIQEKQRLRAQHRDVIDAVVHEVLANGIVPAYGEGDLQLGADAVGTGNEDRLTIFFDIQREKPAETADLAKHFAAMGGGQ